MLRLRVTPAEGDSFDHVIENGTLSIGRSSRCDLTISDRFLSRRHARLFLLEGRWIVEDLGSRNGTFVNGRRTDGDAVIRPGDVITVSASRIKVLRADEDDSEPELATDTPYTDRLLQPAAEVLRRTESPPPDSQDSATTALGRYASRLALLNEIHREMARPTTLDELLELILDHIFAQLEPERAEVFMACDDGSYTCVAGRSLPGASLVSLYSENLFSEVVDKGMAALVKDAQSDHRFARAQSLVSAGVRSLLAAPLAAPGGALGAIVLGSNATLRRDTEEDLELLVTLASVAALRIHNLVLTQESAERRRLEREITLARRIQVELLPERLPEVAGYRLLGATLPSRGVSGDYYQVVERADGDEIVLAVADVSGKGISAAILTGYLEAVTSVPIEDGLAPHEVFNRVSDKLVRRTPPNRFATMFLGVLTPSNGVIRFANAGHTPPCLVRSGGAVEWFASTGLPLGLLTATEYRSAAAVLDPGDTLIVYSDGYTEAENPAGEEFGQARLAEICADNRHREPPELAAEVDRALEAFVAGQPYADDRTIVIVKRFG